MAYDYERVNQILGGPIMRSFQEIMRMSCGSSFEVQAALDYSIKLGLVRQVDGNAPKTSLTLYVTSKFF